MSSQTSPVKYSAELGPTTNMHDKEQTEALTGRILQTDANAEDFIQQPKKGIKRLGNRFVLEVATVVLLLALLGTVVGLAVGLSQSRSNKGIDPACIHALGGGPIKSGGSLDVSSAAPDYCKQQLRAYADPQRGSYSREVDIAMLAAMATFGFAHNGLNHQARQQHTTSHAAGIATQAELQQTGTSAAAVRLSRSLLTVESVSRPAHPASQSEHMQLGGPVATTAGLAAGQDLQAPAPGRDKVVIFDIDETVLSNMPQILDPITWPWDKWVAAAKAPALKPTLQFYRALCAAGYSVAFVTGRKESGRNATMHNLEIEGYGRPCKEGPGPFYGAAPLRSSSDGSNGDSSDCCYSALYLRQVGDTSLASVYKPGARTDLLHKGNMTLLALVGDQFSDLNGEQSAPYAFKLPNPFYYIL